MRSSNLKSLLSRFFSEVGYIATWSFVLFLNVIMSETGHVAVPFCFFVISEISVGLTNVLNLLHFVLLILILFKFCIPNRRHCCMHQLNHFHYVELFSITNWTIYVNYWFHMWKHTQIKRLKKEQRKIAFFSHGATHLEELLSIHSFFLFRILDNYLRLLSQLLPFLQPIFYYFILSEYFTNLSSNEARKWNKSLSVH